MNFRVNPETPAAMPVIPVGQVLFPGESRSIHLSDPRDCAAAQDSHSANRPFGAVLAEGEGTGPVGTSARILRMEISYGGGVEIVAEGQKRFKIMELLHEKPFMSARIEYFDDLVPVLELDRKSQLLERTLEAYGKYLAIMEQGNLPDLLPPYRQTSFRIAATIGGEDLFKRQLLQMLSEDGRLLALSCYFKKLDEGVFRKYPWLASLLREHGFSKN